MHKLLFASFCVLFSINVFCQTTYFHATGKVINAETKLPMQGASVFAENTTLGTVTDQDGKFMLALPNGGYDLIVSYAGFNTKNERISGNASQAPAELTFELSLKEKLMSDVAIVSNGEVKNGWEKYGKFFLEEFIGKTKNSEQCSIKNPEVIKFYFSKRKNRLKVLANESIIIENNAIGYTIKYDMDSFVHEYNSSVTVYSGYPLFEEKKDTSAAQLQIWKNAREETYYGSTLHFMRSLLKKQLEADGFEIQLLTESNGKETAIAVKDYYEALNFVPSDSANPASFYPNQWKFGILYKDEIPAEKYLVENNDAPKTFQFSSITFQNKEKLFIENNGFYYDQSDITFNEYWAWTKMADALPYDYVVE
jgi:hypothetical protein